MPPVTVQFGPTVHPRVCGEHKHLVGPTFDDTGSSPRVRGTPVTERHCELVGRFIPACAGNTQLFADPPYLPSVHPRVCGEHRIWLPSNIWMCGSSPRVRGTLDKHAGHGYRGRFIPACAGNTEPDPKTIRPASVHPRVCGEHDSPPGSQESDYGSSPRVRGTLGLGRHRCPR